MVLQYAVLLAAAVAAAPGDPAAEPAGRPPAADAAGQAPAADAGAADQKSSEERRKLEEEIARQLGVTPSAAAAAAAAAPPQAVPPPGPEAAGTRTGGNPMARLLLLPDVSAIGDFGAAYDSYDAGRLSPRYGVTSPAHQLTPALQELELGFQSVIDPYARADVFIAFDPSGVDVEEAYLTTLSLPAGLQLRAGKFFSPFGRINQQHPHVWEFADAPLAFDRLVAPEVLYGPGADLAWLAPLPWFLEVHLAGQTTQPTGATAQQRTALGRVVQYFDLGETTALGVGASGARVEGGPGGLGRDLGALDVFLKLRPPATRAYVALQGELFARRYDGTTLDGSGLGGYLQAVWREGPYWAYGLRYDAAPAYLVAGTEQRVTALWSWLPSEFQRIRLQVAWDRRPGGLNGLEALLHLEFAIGAHGAHPF